MKLTRAFTGKMDLDSNDRYVQIGDYRLLENGIIDQDGSSSRYVVKNLKSTTEIKDLSISGYKCIGGKVYKGIIYAFYNNDTNTRLYSINTDTPYTSDLLFEFDLGNSLTSKIVDVDFIEDLEGGQLLLYWNDKENQPFKANVTQLADSPTYYSSKEDMYVIKAPPSEPSVVLQNNTDILTNRLIDRAFAFSYSYEYEDGELSSMSQYSDTVFSASTTSETSEYTDRVVNQLNAATVTVNTGDKHVSRFNIYARDNSTSAVYLLEVIDKDAEGLSDNAGYEYVFTNSESYISVDSTYSNMLYSNVPRLAGAQSLIGNRLEFADFTEGYDLGVTEDYSIEEINSVIRPSSVDINDSEPTEITWHEYSMVGIEFPISAGSRFVITDLNHYDDNTPVPNLIADSLDYTTTKVHTSYASLADELNFGLADYGTTFITCVGGVDYIEFVAEHDFQTADVKMTVYEVLATNTLKSGELYKYSILYTDDYDRVFPFTKPLSIQISNAMSRDDVDKVVAKVKMTIGHKAPIGATKYVIARTKNTYGYESFQATIGATNGGNIYIQIPDGDISKIPTDAYRIELYSDGSGLTRNNLSSSIIRIETTSSLSGVADGTHVVIPDNYVSGYNTSDFSDIADSVFYVYASETATSESYYVVSEQYDIVSRNHQGDTNQVYNSVDAEITLDDHDCFVVFDSDNNYREVYRMVNGLSYSSEGKSYIYTDKLKTLRRHASITWSDAYIDDIDYNGLSTFNPSTYNYVDLYKEFGAITGLDEHIGRLLVIQEDKWGVIELNRSITSTATGVQSINKTDNFLLREAWNPFNGDYGSYNYRGFAKFGNTKYAPDKKRKAILRLSTDGLTEISDYNMISYFNDMVDDDEQNNYIGAYNAANNEYWLYDIDTTDIIIFDEKLNGWTRLITPLTVDHMLDYAGVVYTFEDDKIHTHMTGADYGSIHEVQKTFKLKYVENKENATPKVHNAVELESNRGLATSVSDNVTSSQMIVLDYEDREGEFFAYIPNAGSAVNADILETNMIVPMGEVDSNDVTYLTMKNELPRTIRTRVDTLDVGDNVYYDVAGTLTNIGEIISIDGLVVEVDWVSVPTVDFFKDKFVFAVENSYLNARNIRGNTVEVELTDATSNYLEINAVNIEVTQSNNE